MLPNMKDFLLTTAEEAGIKYQYYCAAGGTDAGAAHLQNAGVPSTTIGVCAATFTRTKPFMRWMTS